MDSRLTVVAVVAGDIDILRTKLPQNIDVFMVMDTQRIRLWKRDNNKIVVSNQIHNGKTIAHTIMQGTTLSIGFTCSSGMWPKKYVHCKNFHVPSQHLYNPCKAYAYCWENKYMPRVKNHLPSRTRNHRSVCAMGQDAHAPGMWICLNVEPWNVKQFITVTTELYAIIVYIDVRMSWLIYIRRHIHSHKHAYFHHIDIMPDLCALRFCFFGPGI